MKTLARVIAIPLLLGAAAAGAQAPPAPAKPAPPAAPAPAAPPAGAGPETAAIEAEQALQLGVEHGQALAFRCDPTPEAPCAEQAVAFPGVTKLPKGRWRVTGERGAVRWCRHGDTLLVGDGLCDDAPARVVVVPSPATGDAPVRFTLTPLHVPGQTDAAALKPRALALRNGAHRLPGLPRGASWKIDLPPGAGVVDGSGLSGDLVLFRTPQPDPNAEPDLFCLPFERQLVVTLPAPPTTRVRASLTSTNGEHAELQWDPAVSLRLSQGAVLSAGCWRAAFVVDPFLVSADTSPASVPQVWKIQRAKLSLGAVDRRGWEGPLGEALVDAAAAAPAAAPAAAAAPAPAPAPAAAPAPAPAPGRPRARSPAPPAALPQPRPPAPPPFQATFRLARLPALRDAALALSTAEGGRPGGRAFGGSIPAPVDEALQLLAEIAFEKAKARSLRLLGDELVRFVCQDVALAEVDLNAVSPGLYEELKLATGQTARAGGRLLLLPSTCRIVRSLRIEEIAASGKVVLRAVLTDLALFGQALVATHVRELDVEPEARELLRASLAQVGALAVELARGEVPDGTREAQLVITGLASALDRAIARRGSPTAAQCGLLLGLSVMATCHARERCDARAITDMIRAPKRHFDVGACDGALARVETDWPDLGAFVSRGLSVLVPPAGADARAALRAATALAFEATGRLLREQTGHPGARKRQFESALAALAPPLAALREAERRLAAAAGRDAADGLADARGAVRRAREALEAAERRIAKVARDAADLGRKHDAGRAAEVLDALNALGDEVDAALTSAGFALQALVDARHPELAAQQTQLSLSVHALGHLLQRVRAMKNVLLVVGDLRAVADGVIAADPQPVIAASAQLVQHFFQAYRPAADEGELPGDVEALRRNRARELAVQRLARAARVLAAVTSYAQTYAGDGELGAEQAAARRDARKRALESLLETFTDRSGRGGEIVVSFGTSAGFDVVGWQSRTNRTHDPSAFGGQLALPLGLAIQSLPDPGAAHLWDRVGNHLQLSAIDLGQYLVFDEEGTVNEPKWNALLAPGAQFGFLFGSASDGFVVGADVHYAPALFGRSAPALRAGLFVAYYVPFVDLN